MHKHPDLPAAFAELGVETPWLHALAQLEFTQPTDIQRELIPRILAEHDVLGQARTGTGKTLAFGLPISQKADPKHGFQALVLVPTRELAVQVAAEITRVNTLTKIRCVPVYGGQRIKSQLHALGRRPHIIVGTPGRTLDLLGRGAIRFDEIRFAVLDEVDRMLDIGFRDDIRRILSQIRTPHHTAFVSATLDDEIKRLAMQYMHEPDEINVSRDELTVDEVAQKYISLRPEDKFRALLTLLRHEDPKLAIVFCNTKSGARKLAHRLHGAGIDATEIHGDLVQRKRDRVMQRFRKHQLRVLVATDLASRGIDVHAISHIFNYDIPDDPEVYVHRIGRTARMGANGRAFSFVTPEQGKQLTEIEKLINKLIDVETIDGFDAPAPAAPIETPNGEPPKPSRYAQSVYDGEASPAESPPVAKTLGSKFRPARRRRRL